LNKYTRKDLSELFNIGKEPLRYYENINIIYTIYRVDAVNKKSFFENRIKWYLKKVNYLYIVR
jgi:MerR family mercuric resistance operon transcriptional regulator